MQSKDSGQATIEVILLAFIAVVIILGVVYRFNTAFRRYTTELYGNYYRCLLETGELPGTGSVCKDRAARFQVANGRELLKWQPDPSVGGSSNRNSPNSSSGRGGSPGSSESKKNQSGETGGASTNSSSSSSGGDSVAAGGAASGRSQSVVGRLGQISRRNGATAVGSADSMSDDEKALAGGSIGSLKVGAAGARGGESLRGSRTMVGFNIDDGTLKKGAALEAPISGASKGQTDRTANSLRPRKVAESMDRKPAKANSGEDSSGMDFGRLLRIFMILVIIVAIFVFIGGQILQISKSAER